MTNEGSADAGALGGLRNRFPYGNMRAKLPNYIGQVIECKAGAHIIPEDRTCTDGVGRVNPETYLVPLVCLVCSVCLIKPYEPA